MPVDYYPQKTEAELLVMLDAVQKRSTVGGIVSTEAAGLKQTRSFSGSGSAALEMRRILYSLWKRNPDDYINPYADRVRRTNTTYRA